MITSEPYCDWCRKKLRLKARKKAQQTMMCVCLKCDKELNKMLEEIFK